MSKISNFTDLNSWQKAQQLVEKIYRHTKKFPRHEKYGLTNQLQRASVSVSSNIAESFGRKSKKEKIQFYYYALASLKEISCQLIIAQSLKYISPADYHNLHALTEDVGKLISGSIRYLRKKLENF